MSELNKITDNKIQPSQNSIANNIPKEVTTKFNNQLTSLKIDELAKLFKNNYGASLTISNVLKNDLSISNAFSNLTGNNNIIITEQILLRMLQNSTYMEQIISRVIAYFNIKNAELNGLAPGLRPITSGVILFPDGTIGFWPFSFADTKLLVPLQKNKDEEKRKEAHLKRIRELSEKRHREIRSKNWQNTYTEVDNQPFVKNNLIDQFLKKDK